MNFVRKCSTALIAFSALFVFVSVAMAQDVPPRHNFALAKQAVWRAQNVVRVLIERTGGGGEQDQCARIRNPGLCVQTSGCYWDYEMKVCRKHFIPRNGTDRDDERRFDENDFAANFALQGMGAGLTRLGQKIDEAAAAWGTPWFFGPWGEACQGASNLLLANQAAKVSASLPPPGFVTPMDFMPIDTELHSVRSLLFCP